MPWEYYTFLFYDSMSMTLSMFNDSDSGNCVVNCGGASGASTLNGVVNVTAYEDLSVQLRGGSIESNDADVVPVATVGVIPQVNGDELSNVWLLGCDYEFENGQKFGWFVRNAGNMDYAPLVIPMGYYSMAAFFFPKNSEWGADTPILSRRWRLSTYGNEDYNTTDVANIYNTIQITDEPDEAPWVTFEVADEENAIGGIRRVNLLSPDVGFRVQSGAEQRTISISRTNLSIDAGMTDGMQYYFGQGWWPSDDDIDNLTDLTIEKFDEWIADLSLTDGGEATLTVPVEVLEKMNVTTDDNATFAFVVFQARAGCSFNNSVQDGGWLNSTYNLEVYKKHHKSSKSGSDLSTGGIIGIVVASVFVVGLAIWFVLMRKSGAIGGADGYHAVDG
jgi:hypothetical protein